MLILVLYLVHWRETFVLFLCSSLNSSWSCLLIETVGFTFLSRDKSYVESERAINLCISEVTIHTKLL